jgi:hypothetical protein
MILAFSLIACGTPEASNNNEADSSTEENNVVENEPEVTEAVEETTEDTGEELAVGKRIPNYQLTTLDGETVSLHDYDGKIILLNFWATW